MRMTSGKAAVGLLDVHVGAQWVGFTHVLRYAGTNSFQRRVFVTLKRQAMKVRGVDNPFEYGIAIISSRGLQLGCPFSRKMELAAGRTGQEVEQYETGGIWPNRAGEPQGRHCNRLQVEHIPTGHISYKGAPGEDTETGEVRPVKRRQYHLNQDDTLGEELTSEEWAIAEKLLPSKSAPSPKAVAYMKAQDAAGTPVPNWRYMRQDNVLELRHNGRVVTVTDTLAACWGPAAIRFDDSRDGSIVKAD